jgi:Family of unknown function (DUF6283)
MRLKRTTQCSNCPWRRDSDLANIKGYERDLHVSLESTISEGDLKQTSVMACHESIDPFPDPCIGWLSNQLGEGNNLWLRIRMLKCENIDELQTYGSQCRNFQETLRV